MFTSIIKITIIAFCTSSIMVYLSANMVNTNLNTLFLLIFLNQFVFIYMVIKMYDKSDLLLKLYMHSKYEAEVYRILTENSTEPLLLLDKSFCVRYVNQSFTKKFGYELEDIKDKSFTTLLLNSDLSKIKDIENNLTQLQKGTNIVRLHIKHKCNVFVPVVCNFGAFINKTNESILTVTVSIQDVSECYQHRSQLNKIEKYFDFVYKNVDNSFVITTENGTIIQYNDQFKKLLRIDSLTELVGKNILTVFDSSKTKEIEDFVYNNIDIGDSIREFELVLNISKKKSLPVLVRALRITLNNINSFIFIIRDIQIRKKKEELLKQSAAINSIFVSTIDYGYNIENALRLLNHFCESSCCIIYENIDVIDNNYFKCVYHDVIHNLINVRTNILFPYDIFNCIDQNRNPLIVNDIDNIDNKHYSIDINFFVFVEYLKLLNIKSFLIYPLYSGDYFWGFILLAKVITSDWDNYTIDLLQSISTSLINIIQRSRVEKFLYDKVSQKNEDLKKSNKDLEEFAYFISHDLVSPVRQMSICINGIEKELYDKQEKISEDMKINLEFLKDGCKRMIARVEGLLEYSKLNTRKIRKNVVDVNKVINNVLFDLDNVIKQNNINIILCKDSFPEISADKQLCEQVFQNLISNAIKFTSNCLKPTIKIDYHLYSHDENKCVFCIEDNGIGIEEKYLSKIFNIFMKIDSNDNSGCGIGLSLVKKIIELHDQKIWVESTYGKGTKFFFTFNLYLKNGK